MPTPNGHENAQIINNIILNQEANKIKNAQRVNIEIFKKNINNSLIAENHINLNFLADHLMLNIESGKIEQEHIIQILDFIAKNNQEHISALNKINAIRLGHNVKITRDSLIFLMQQLEQKQDITRIYCEAYFVTGENKNELTEAFISLFEKKQNLIEFESYIDGSKNYDISRSEQAIKAIMRNYNLTRFGGLNAEGSKHDRYIVTGSDPDVMLFKHIQKNKDNAQKILEYILNYENLSAYHQTRLKMDLAIRMPAVEYYAKRNQATYQKYLQVKKTLKIDNISSIQIKEHIDDQLRIKAEKTEQYNNLARNNDKKSATDHEDNDLPIYEPSVSEIARKAANNAVENYFKDPKNKFRISISPLMFITSIRGAIFIPLIPAIAITATIAAYRMLPKAFAILKTNRFFLPLASFGVGIAAFGVAISGFFAIHKIAYKAQEKRIIHNMKKINPEIMKTCKVKDLQNAIDHYECNILNGR